MKLILRRCRPLGSAGFTFKPAGKKSELGLVVTGRDFYARFFHFLQSWKSGSLAYSAPRRDPELAGGLPEARPPQNKPAPAWRWLKGRCQLCFIPDFHPICHGNKKQVAVASKWVSRSDF